MDILAKMRLRSCIIFLFWMMTVVWLSDLLDELINRIELGRIDGKAG